MNMMQRGNDYCTAHGCQNYGVVNCIPFGFGIVHGREEFHERISLMLQYKTILPILEIKDLDIGGLAC